MGIDTRSGKDIQVYARRENRHTGKADRQRDVLLTKHRVDGQIPKVLCYGAFKERILSLHMCPTAQLLLHRHLVLTLEITK